LTAPARHKRVSHPFAIAQELVDRLGPSRACELNLDHQKFSGWPKISCVAPERPAAHQGSQTECSMRSLHLAGWLAVGVVAFTATSNAAQQMCKPALAVTEAGISEAQNRQRTWTGVLSVDASPCSSASGEFETSLLA
jgi:hypothetical protein